MHNEKIATKACFSSCCSGSSRRRLCGTEHLRIQRRKTESSEEESKTEVFSVKTDDIKSLEFIVDKKEVTFEKKDDSWVKRMRLLFL